MSTCFQNILVPIDFSANADAALKKAVSLADDEATIHLLHVSHSDLYRKHFPGWIRISENAGRIKTVEKLNGYKKLIHQSGKKLSVKIWITRSWSTQGAIEYKAKKLGVDLIVIAKSNNHNFLPFLNTVVSTNLAGRTGAAVLTIKPGAGYNKVKTIVVPVTSENIKRKLELIAAFNKKFPLHIHLVTFIDSKNKPVEFYASSLLRAYQWLKASTHCPVEYSVLHGRNKAKVLLDYAKKFDADVLLLYSQTETRVNWLNVQISDMVPTSSKVEVLAIRQETMQA